MVLRSVTEFELDSFLEKAKRKIQYPRMILPRKTWPNTSPNRLSVRTEMSIKIRPKDKG